MVEQKPKTLHQVKIVVDTNIVYSGILNSASRIGRLLIASRQHFQFYSCDFLRHEINKHRTKLQKLTKLPLEELLELENLVTRDITFINERLIPETILISVERLVTDIDSSDTPFVALARHLNAKLWTGDMALVRGLKAK